MDGPLWDVEVDMDDITLGNKLAEGALGTVDKAKLNQYEVFAVKFLKYDEPNQKVCTGSAAGHIVFKIARGV